MELRSNLALLATGTLLNVVSQLLVSSYEFADKRSHVIPWIKYTATIVPAALSRLRQQRQRRQGAGGARARAGPPPPPLVSPQQRSVLALIGVLDVMAYTIYTLAYFSCGAALSNLLLAASAQVLTALSTRLLLKRRLNNGQWTGIVLIVTGLGIRALPSGSGGVALQPEQWQGVAMILVAACLYTYVGILYERLTKGAAKPPPHTEVMWHTSKLGFITSTAFQLLYTLPRLNTLVRQRMAANHLTFSQLAPVLGGFGLLFNLHMLAQSLVFRADGAIGVGVCNSVRGAVLTVVTSLFFCTPGKPWLCMTLQSGASAAVTTLGGIVWVLCDPKAAQQRRPQPGTEAGKGKEGTGGKDKAA